MNAEFLYSPDIVDVGIQALGLAGLAMAFSPRIKREVRELQEGKCHACGCIPCGCLEIHHRNPRFFGGTDGIDNAVGLCQDCHQDADRKAFGGQIYPQVHKRERS